MYFDNAMCYRKLSGEEHALCYDEASVEPDLDQKSSMHNFVWSLLLALSLVQTTVAVRRVARV